MKFDLHNKVVIITGASSGIGAASALAISKLGAKVVLASRNIDKLNLVANKCTPKNNVLVVVTDISKESDCKNLIDKTVEHFGRLDALVCNAGKSMRGLVENTSVSVFRELMDVNFWGCLYCTQAAMPHLLKSRGMLVGVSSVSGFKSLAGRSGYSASKHALNGFLDCVKTENLKTGVHVLTFCPGFTATDIRLNALNERGETQAETPRNEEKMMKPEEVAHKLCQSIQQKKDFVVLTKEGKIIYWLSKFVPNFISKKIFEEFAKEPNSPLRIQPLNE
ncbi:MAG: SDR family oxidoreductase [Flavobacteriales bacterium]|nr:SDR family oxidoreductase [Flavobacteriales bacterium]